MQRFYSQSTGCTYLEGIHETMPDDAVEMTEELYQAVIASPPPGKVREHRDGLPYLVDAEPVAPSLEQVQALRSAAYRAESDPIKIEAEYDAMEAGTEPDYTAWRAKVAEIKERYPLPDQ